MKRLIALTVVFLSFLLFQSPTVKAVTLSPSSGRVSANSVVQLEIIAKPPASITANSVTLRLNVTNATVNAVELDSALTVKVGECAGNTLYTANEVCATLGKTAGLKDGDKLGTITLTPSGNEVVVSAEDGSLYSGTSTSGAATTSAISGELGNYAIVASNTLTSAPVSTPTTTGNNTVTTRTTSNSDLGLLVAALGVVLLGIFFVLFLLIRNAMKARGSKPVSSPPATTGGKLLSETVTTTAINNNGSAVSTTATVSTPVNSTSINNMNSGTTPADVNLTNITSTTTTAPAPGGIPALDVLQPPTPAQTATLGTEIVEPFASQSIPAINPVASAVTNPVETIPSVPMLPVASENSAPTSTPPVAPASTETDLPPLPDLPEPPKA